MCDQGMGKSNQGQYSTLGQTLIRSQLLHSWPDGRSKGTEQLLDPGKVAVGETTYKLWWIKWNQSLKFFDTPFIRTGGCVLSP